MTLSICLVTRNDEANMERALRSVAGLADEMVIGDTGSTDRTAAIATGLGARVIDIGWDDDFGKARNRVIAEAKGDWILWLNPDEEVLASGYSRIRDSLKRPDALAYVVRVTDLLTAPPSPKKTETMQPRCFRRDCGTQYCGRLHPHFAPPLEEVATSRGQMIFALDAMVLRHAYQSVLTPAKLRWAAHLLELELRDRPAQLHYLIEYGRTLLQLNEPLGHEVLAQAVAQVLAMREAPAAPDATVGSLFEYVLTVSAEQSRCRMSPIEAVDLALRWFRNTPPVIWAVAQYRFASADFAGAATLLEDLLNMGQSGKYDHSAGFDPDIMGAPALMNLGKCYLQMGQPDKARHCFGQLLTHPTLQAQARALYARTKASDDRKPSENLPG